MAASWMAISNTLARVPLKPNRSPAMIKCPVLEMGKNSVNPSTMPRIRAFNRSIGSIGVSGWLAKLGN
jgi:hypothetical protein